MTRRPLAAAASALVADGRGLLAADESVATCNKRFEAAGIPQTEAARRAYRSMLVTTPGLAECVGGVILSDETIRQSGDDGEAFVDVLTRAGMVAGVKVDGGAKDLAGHPGETVTEGLDGLRQRLRDYAAMGAGFAKWRAVYAVGDGTPSRGCVVANAQALARYAALCQEAGLVPVVEADILTEGAHTLDRCGAVAEEVLGEVFHALRGQRVALEGMILKPSMVTPGTACPDQVSVEAVAEATVACLSRAVPAAVPGVAFLSGGQSGALASARLNAIKVRRLAASRLPWALTFSFARAIQHPALEVWDGRPANVGMAQRAVLHRAACNRAALQGAYDARAEADDVARRSDGGGFDLDRRNPAPISSDPAWREHLAAIRTTHGLNANPPNGAAADGGAPHR